MDFFGYPHGLLQWGSNLDLLRNNLLVLKVDESEESLKFKFCHITEFDFHETTLILVPSQWQNLRPDLYIPVMSYVTYVLIYGLHPAQWTIGPAGSKNCRLDVRGQMGRWAIPSHILGQAGESMLWCEPHAEVKRCRRPQNPEISVAGEWD
jgi:hypothetical protein